MAEERHKRIVWRLWKDIDKDEKKKWDSYLPVTRGPRFAPPKIGTIFNATSLTVLAAKIVGECLAPGIAGALECLKAMPLPPVLIKAVHPYLTLNEAEYTRYLHYEWYFPTSTPGYYRTRQINAYYNTLYPEASKYYHVKYM
jgi:hypothetical protein